MNLSNATTDALLATWLLNFSTLISAAPATYGLEAGDAAAIATASSDFNDALTIATDPSTRTPAAIAAKDNAKTAALVVVRPYALSISLSPAVTDEDKTAVGATVRKLVPTPIPAPSALPLVSLVSAIPGQALLKIVSADTPTTKAKPFGAVGVQIFASVGTAAATDPEQLKFVQQSSKLPARVDFDSADKGKICSLAARYVTKGGNGGVSKVGPWSEIVTFNVI